MIKLNPVIKEYIWGTETWEVSTHPDGITQGTQGTQGDRSLVSCDIPIIIKTIDARDKLSLQVHPNDEYALKHENQSGKNEMWYIAEAKPGAELILGFKEPLSRDELKHRIENNTILDKVRHVPVKAGDSYCIPAGMLHAIGKGIKIIEVQQSSNVTYRVYDYDRRDSNGNPRELHIDKALDVLDTTIEAIKANPPKLADWKYFNCELLTTDDGTTKLRTVTENIECLTSVETGETIINPL